MNQREFIRSLLEWIESNLGHDLHLDEVARRAGYSRWHLQRLFRRVYSSASFDRVGLNAAQQ